VLGNTHGRESSGQLGAEGSVRVEEMEILLEQGVDVSGVLLGGDGGCGHCERILGIGIGIGIRGIEIGGDELV
jgi:hypothetical protein